MSLFGDTAVRATPAIRYAVAVGLSFLCFAARLALNDSLGSHLPFSFFYIAIAGAAAFGGIGPGVVALVFSIFAGDFFFLDASLANGIFELEKLPLVLTLGHTGIGVFLIAVMDGSRRAAQRAAKSAEEAAAAHALMRENHDFLEAILAHAEVGIVLFDGDGKYVRVNPAFARIFEYSVEEMQGMHYSRVLPDALKTEAEKVKESRLAGHSEPREWQVVTKSGGTRYVRVSGSRAITVQGKKMALSVVLDTTAERELVRARQESEERFRLLADSSPTLIWVTDAAGQLLFVNQRYVQFFGRRVEEVRTHGWQPLVHADDRAAYAGAYEEALRRRSTFRAQARVQDARGHWRWIDSHALPRTGPDGKFLGHVGSSADITDIRNAQVALEGMNAELEQKVAERTTRWKEIVGELEAVTYALAHDLRSPLLSMKGYSEILLSTYGSVVDADGKHYLQRIVVAAQRLDHLIQDVLNYNRIVRKELPLGRVELARLLREVVDSYPRLKGHRETISLPNDIPAVRGNAGALAQAVAALLENGVKFVPKDRTPTLRVTWAPGANSANGTPTVKVVIEDNGIGIEPAAMPRLFKLFERLHKEYEGTGVGLAIARKAIERMGGKIGAESTHGRGSRFWIELLRAE